jgi:hypothetical protein
VSVARSEGYDVRLAATGNRHPEQCHEPQEAYMIIVQTYRAWHEETAGEPVQRARGVRIARERWAAEEPETRQMVADEYAHAALWRARGTTHM